MEKDNTERFWSKVDIRGEDDCWEWQATRTTKGYGHFSVDGKMKYAHRVAYMLTTGPIKSGMQIMHSCDNPPCCNPRHLSQGTNAENAATARHDQFGEKNPTARLTADDVRAIRASTESSTVLAKQYGCTHQNINRIQSRRTWKHL